MTPGLPLGFHQAAGWETIHKALPSLVFGGGRAANQALNLDFPDPWWIVLFAMWYPATHLFVELAHGHSSLFLSALGYDLVR